MSVAVVVLVLLDVVVLSVVLTAVLRRRRSEEPAPDGELLLVPRPAGQRARERRVLTIEIRDPQAVARSRGRALGIAGTLAPGLVTRVVYDQTRKTLLRELASYGVQADVRLHVLRPAASDRPVVPQTIVEATVVDAPPPLDLGRPGA